MSTTSHPVILSARRTPIGRFLGAYTRTKSTTLGSLAIDAALAAAPASRDHVDECIMGCVLQAGLGQNPARQAGLGADLPTTLSAQTINKVCGSGLQAVMLAAQSIKAGDNELVVAGGMENMSAAPHLAHVRGGIKFGEGTLIDHMQLDGLTCAFENWAMGCAADHIATVHSISREEQDRFAAQSHQRAANAWEQGWFDAEVQALTGEDLGNRRKPGPDGGLAQDEGIRGDSTAEGLGKLRAAFGKEGSVTAGNASQISDGAGAVVVASAEKAAAIGAEPLAHIVDYCTSGVDPKEIFNAPAVGVAMLLERNKLSVADIDIFEMNEAFAAQALANAKVLGLDESKVNVAGGAVAIGHPIGASGARVLVTLVHQLIRTGGKRGVVSLCLGGGNAVNMLIERS